MAKFEWPGRLCAVSGWPELKGSVTTWTEEVRFDGLSVKTGLKLELKGEPRELKSRVKPSALSLQGPPVLMAKHTFKRANLQVGAAALV